MKIIQIPSGEARIPATKGGGVEAYILNLSKYMAKLGNEVIILDRKYASKDDVQQVGSVRIERLTAQRYDKLPLTLSSVLNQVSFIIKISKYLGANNFDIVSLHNSINSLVLSIICPTFRRKMIYTSHINRRLKNKLSFNDYFALIIENFVLKQVKKTVVFTDSIRQKMLDSTKISPQKIITIPIGLDMDNFDGSFNYDSNIKRKYNCEGKTIILFVGRISEDKGVEFLVKSANLIVNKSKYQNLTFLLVGPFGGFSIEDKNQSGYADYIEELIDDFKLGEYVKLVGAVQLDDLKKLFAICDIFVLPSLSEAMPSSPLEAMAYSKPVIGTSVGGIPMEIVNERSGFIVNPADEKCLAEKIIILLDSPNQAKNMGKYGRKILEEKFDIMIVAKELINIYQSLNERKFKLLLEETNKSKS